LRELWTNNFLAQIETKTGSITLVNAGPKKRPNKRRKIDSSDFDVEIGRGKKVTGRDESIQPQDNDLPIDTEPGNFYDQEYDLGGMGA
jgi:hypothetical protein